MFSDEIELRVLGCLIEKQRTTPDVYPLSLNSLRLACNQATNREPVVDYDEPTIRAALDRLGRRGWTRLASGATSRAIKYRHLLDEVLKLDGRDISLLTVLMLRGPQTPGELNQRGERPYHIGSLEEVERALTVLVERDLVEVLPRRPGMKKQRYRQLLGVDEGGHGSREPALAGFDSEEGYAAEPAPRRAPLEERVAATRERVAAMEEQLRRLDRRRPWVGARGGRVRGRSHSIETVAEMCENRN